MNTMGRVIWVVLLAFNLFSSGGLRASLLEDLASPSQEKRDTAAKALRETYALPPRANWDGLVKSLKLGTPKTTVERQLQSSNFLAEAGYADGSMYVQTYRLDNFWVIECSFANVFSKIGDLEREAKHPPGSVPTIPMSSFTNGALASVDLQKRLREIWIAPPTNFTGIWRTYRANGQPSTEIEYLDGKRNGRFKSFYEDGATAVISHATNDANEGEESGFYPSGKIKYKGQYKDGHQVGKWRWYKEDGSVESERDYDSKR